MKGHRLQRLEKELTRVIEVVISDSLQDRRLIGLTVTGVKLTADLQHAKIYYHTIDMLDKKLQNSIKELNELLKKSSGFIKNQIAGARIMRCIPELSFEYDTTEEKARHMDSIFASIEASKKRNNDEFDEEDGDSIDDYEDIDELEDLDEYEDYDDDYEDYGDFEYNEDDED